MQYYRDYGSNLLYDNGWNRFQSPPIASAKNFFLDLICGRVITSLYKVLSNPNPYHQQLQLPLTCIGGRRRVELIEDLKKLKMIFI